MHTAYTWDGTYGKLFVDGSLAAQTATAPWQAGGVGLTIGSYPGTWTWKGKIDEMAVFTRALSPTEVQTHSQNRLTGDGLGDACDPCPNDADPSCGKTTCVDADGDGYGVKGASNCAAGYPELFDCADNDATVHPGAVDVPWDGVDNDCNGYTDVPMQDARTYQWDGNGNLLGEGREWDARDRLVSGGYGYDTGNLRVKMGAQTVLLDGIEEAREYGTEAKRYDHDPSRVDGLLAQTTSAGKGYFVTDALGSVYGVVDASGAVVSRYGYDVYGARTASTEGMPTGWGFTGRRHDSGAEMYYRARYLDGDVGAFRSVDPKKRSHWPDRHAYQYANRNPVTISDPTGEFIVATGDLLSFPDSTSSTAYPVWYFQFSEPPDDHLSSLWHVDMLLRYITTTRTCNDAFKSCARPIGSYPALHVFDRTRVYYLASSPPGMELLGKPGPAQRVLNVSARGPMTSSSDYPVAYTKYAWREREKAGNDRVLAGIILHEMSHHAGAVDANPRTEGDANWVVNQCLGLGWWR